MTEEYCARGLDVPEYLKRLRNYPSLVKTLMKEARAEREPIVREN